MTLDRMSDAELIAAVRRGDGTAYGVLYQRHLDAARRAAACLAASAAEREDLVADAFTKVLRALRAGGGPDEEFRAYLLVTMRNAAISSSRRATVSLYADVPENYLPRPGGDPVLTRFDTSAAAAAFASLPERWRMVLWHTEVEGESPAEIAKLLGMRPNGVAALAYRAREGLRQAYLRAHLPEVASRECSATVSKLAGFVRHSVPVPLGRKITRHLASCADCRARAATISKVNDELRAWVGPLLLGAPLAAAYLPTAATSGVVAKTLLAKVGVVVAVAATAAATVASNPVVEIAEPTTPHLDSPTMVTSTITGPSGAPVTTAGMPVVPPEGNAANNDTPGNSGNAGNSTNNGGNNGGTTGPPPAVAEAKQAKEDAKAQRKAEQDAAKAQRKADKAEEKAQKEADKTAKKPAK